MPPVALDPHASPELVSWFAAEVQPHEAALRGWLRLRFPSVGDRDDLIQESYIRLWKARLTGPIDAPKSYLFAIARNLALNHLRHARFECDIGEIDLSGILDEELPIPDQVVRNQELLFLQQAFQSLPEKCREVFVLRRIYGLSQKEIAARLGISEKTVESQSFKAMKKCLEFFREKDLLSRPAPAIEAVPPPSSVPVRAALTS